MSIVAALPAWQAGTVAGDFGLPLPRLWRALPPMAGLMGMLEERSQYRGITDADFRYLLEDWRGAFARVSVEQSSYGNLMARLDSVIYEIANQYVDQLAFAAGTWRVWELDTLGAAAETITGVPFVETSRAAAYSAEWARQRYVMLNLLRWRLRTTYEYTRRWTWRGGCDYMASEAAVDAYLDDTDNLTEQEEPWQSNYVRFDVDTPKLTDRQWVGSITYMTSRIGAGQEYAAEAAANGLLLHLTYNQSMSSSLTYCTFGADVSDQRVRGPEWISGAHYTARPSSAPGTRFGAYFDIAVAYDISARFTLPVETYPEDTVS